MRRLQDPLCGFGLSEFLGKRARFVIRAPSPRRSYRSYSLFCLASCAEFVFEQSYSLLSKDHCMQKDPRITRTKHYSDLLVKERTTCSNSAVRDANCFQETTSDRRFLKFGPRKSWALRADQESCLRRRPRTRPEMRRA